MKTKIVSIMAACFCAISFCAKPAEATLITIQIEAVVDSVRDEGGYLEGKISPGDIITGAYTYDLLTPDSEPLAYAGIYEHDSAPGGISLSVGGFDFTTDPDNVDFVVAVLNDYPPWGKDQVWMTSYNNLPLGNGVAVDIISWQLDDPTGTGISSTELPTSPLVLDDWQSNILAFGADRRYGIFAHVTSAVPEPATIMLVAIGAVFLRKRS